MEKIEIKKVSYDINEYKNLILEYGKGIYQDDYRLNLLYEEVDELENRYVKNGGCLIGAYYNNELCGCIAYRKTDWIGLGCCEIKRFYIRKGFRGKGIGVMLLTNLLKEAKKSNYNYAYLDTFVEMKKAIQLYESFGFEKTEPYFDTEIGDIIFYKKDLNNER